MGRFEMNGVDLKRLQLAHQILADVVDRLVEVDEVEIEIEVQPVAATGRTPQPSDHGVQDLVLDSLLSSIG